MTLRGVIDLRLLAAGGGVDADDGGGVGGVGRVGAVGGQHRLRDLKGDRVDVRGAERVDPVVHAECAAAGVQRGEGPQVAEVEHRAEIDEERVGPLAGEHLLPGGESADGSGGERRVVRGGQRADVAGRARKRGAHRGRGAPLHLGHVVGLPAVPGRVAERGDRPGVVQEARRRVRRRGAETELVADVGLRAGVGDVDLVPDVVAELVEVRPSRGRLERDEVGDDGHRVRRIRADERIDVGVVGNRVAGDVRRFTMR